MILSLYSFPLPPSAGGGGGGFRRGRISLGETIFFAVKKGGEIFHWQNFGGTVPSLATAAGIVSSEKSQARQISPDFMHLRKKRLAEARSYAAPLRKHNSVTRLWRCVGIWESLSGGCLVSSIAVVRVYGAWSFGYFKGGEIIRGEIVPGRNPLPHFVGQSPSSAANKLWD